MIVDPLTILWVTIVNNSDKINSNYNKNVEYLWYGKQSLISFFI